MQTPVQIAFHGIDKSDAVESRIHTKIAKLEHYFDRITSCKVTVERNHRSHSNLKASDQPFHVSIVLGVPGEDLVVKRDPKDKTALKDHEDIQIALRDAFSAMERRLKDYVQRRWRDGRHNGIGVAIEEDVATS